MDTFAKFNFPDLLIKEYKYWYLMLRYEQPTLGSLILITKYGENQYSKITKNGEIGVYDPKGLPDYQLTNPIIIGSGVSLYINELKERYGHLNPFYDEKKYALAGVIAKLSQNRFLENFTLVNASPSYIRNKVADTIIERREGQ